MIEKIIKECERKVSEQIEMIYISALSKLNISSKTNKEITVQKIENYLKRRGYSQNYLLGKPVMTKGFTVVCVNENHIEYWHDVKNSKSSFIHKNFLTSLPITLDYMERI